MSTAPYQTTNRNVRFYDLSGGDSNVYRVQNTCPFCSGLNNLKLQGNQYFAHFQKGEFVQHAFPQLDAGDRELILTGSHPECWDKAFKDSEDEEVF